MAQRLTNLAALLSRAGYGNGQITRRDVCIRGIEIGGIGNSGNMSVVQVMRLNIRAGQEAVGFLIYKNPRLCKVTSCS